VPDSGQQFVRVQELDRPVLHIRVDGQTVGALAGDTVLVAVLTAGCKIRRSEFGDGNRAGFCLMSACQDCWMWTEAGQRLRACATAAVEGMKVFTEPREAPWALRE
jgi:D-hydroxyproline dehydrogenase subunit gamma